MQICDMCGNVFKYQQAESEGSVCRKCSAASEARSFGREVMTWEYDRGIEAEHDRLRQIEGQFAMLVEWIRLNKREWDEEIEPVRAEAEATVDYDYGRDSRLFRFDELANEFYERVTHEVLCFADKGIPRNEGEPPESIL